MIVPPDLTTRLRTFAEEAAALRVDIAPLAVDLPSLTYLDGMLAEVVAAAHRAANTLTEGDEEA